MEEMYQTKVDEVFSQYFDATIEEGIDEAEMVSASFPKRHRKYIRKEMMDEIIGDLADLERTHRFLKSEKVHENDIEEVHHYGDYYSDRRVGAKNQYRDAPRDRPPPRKDRHVSARIHTPRYSKR